jgi:hypothetical protein
MGTHISGAWVAEALKVHDSKRRTSSRQNHTLGGPREAIDAEIFLITNLRSRRARECAQFVHTKRTITLVVTDSALITKPIAARLWISMKENAQTHLYAISQERICDRNHY